MSNQLIPVDQVHTMAMAVAKSCSVDGCETKIHCKELCKKHYMKLRRHGNPTHGTFHSRKRGTGTLTKDGYIEIKVGARSVLEHIYISESAIGKRLPDGAQVHHVNGNGADNRRENLVICQDASYHHLLHRRTRSLDATGNPNMVKCQYCKEWDFSENIKEGKRVKYHASCKNEYEARRTANV